MQVMPPTSHTKELKIDRSWPEHGSKNPGVQRSWANLGVSRDVLDEATKRSSRTSVKTPPNLSDFGGVNHAGEGGSEALADPMEYSSRLDAHLLDLFQIL